MKTNYDKKYLVKVAVKDKNKKDLIKDLERSKKAKKVNSKPFEIKNYFNELKLNEARSIFKHKSKMMQYTKMNFKNDPIFRTALW